MEKISTVSMVKAVKWLSIIKPDKKNSYLSHRFSGILHVDEKYLCTTDGKRVHIYYRDDNSQPVASGNYRPVKSGKEYILEPVDVQYPNIDRVIPERAESKKSVKLGKNENLNLYYMYKEFDECLNIQYTLDALSMHEIASETPSAYWYGAGKAIDIQAGQYRAIIMPIAKD